MPAVLSRNDVEGSSPVGPLGDFSEYPGGGPNPRLAAEAVPKSFLPTFVRVSLIDFAVWKRVFWGRRMTTWNCLRRVICLA